MTEKKFPKGFYWGAGSSAHQVEGGIENCDWAEAARQGRIPPAGQACDHYNRFEEDFDLANELGHNAHRFSIEWARIEPEEGKFNQAEVEHYRQVLQALHARGITPFVTIWHFTLPLWFSESGGFERKDSPEIFARYAAFVVDQFSDLCQHFTTINEPMVFAGLGWMKGNWPPFKKWRLVSLVEWTHSGDREKARPQSSFLAFLTYRKVVKNLLRAHILAYKTIKQTHPKIDLGFVKHVVAYDSDRNPFNKLRAIVEDWIFNQTFLRPAAKYCDSIGLNFYHYVKFGHRAEYKKSDMGWEIAPEGIYHAIMMLWRKYHKPIYISEAGIADDDDSDRPEYIRKQAIATWQAIQDGADVRGNMYWSFMDNYELALGYEKRFGIIEVDYETQERKPRPSAYVYKKIIENNGIVE